MRAVNKRLLFGRFLEFSTNVLKPENLPKNLTERHFMLMQVKKHILLDRIARLRGHLENVNISPGFERALTQAEKELQSLDAQREEQPQKS